MFLKLNAAVTIAGDNVATGDVIELSDFSAKALIAEGKAEQVTPDEETAGDLGNSEGSEGDNNPEDENGPEGAENASDDVEPETQEEDQDQALKMKALNDKYNRDPLAEKAKEVGVEFAYDARKAEIIDAVMEAGKADVLLEAE